MTIAIPVLNDLTACCVPLSAAALSDDSAVCLAKVTAGRDVLATSSGVNDQRSGGQKAVGRPGLEPGTTEGS
jgi:hypothetical protein